MTEEKEKQRTKLDESYLWPLALSYLKRADDAANYLRALLFTLSSAAIAYLVIELKDKLICGYAVALISFALAIALIVISWDVQKKKAGRRFEALRDFGYSNYLQVNDEIRKSAFIKNHVLDRSAYIVILFGIVVAIITKISLLGKP
jgi:DMSO/TMAO reductase YedYZ heme-binding membrane subunit